MSPKLWLTWLRFKPAYGVQVLSLIGVTCVLIAISLPQEQPIAAAATCDPHTIAAQILKTERPQMGPIETQMWLDVLTKHYEAHGVSVALGASLLAQENQFRTHRLSSVGAQGAFQIMPKIWKGTPECPKNADLFEIEVAAECSARILAKYIKDGGSFEAGLRHYVGGYRGQAKAQWYADDIVTRLARATAQCPAFRDVYLVKAQ